MRLFFIALLAAVWSFNSLATPKGADQLDSVGEKFMASIMSAKTKQAYTDLSPIVGVNLEQFNQAGEQAAGYMEKVRERIGEPLSFDLISTQKIKQHFIKQTYLLKFKTAALVWELTYYRPEAEWKLVGINYSTDIDALFPH